MINSLSVICSLLPQFPLHDLFTPLATTAARHPQALRFPLTLEHRHFLWAPPHHLYCFINFFIAHKRNLRHAN